MMIKNDFKKNTNARTALIRAEEIKARRKHFRKRFSIIALLLAVFVFCPAISLIIFSDSILHRSQINDIIVHEESIVPLSGLPLKLDDEMEICHVCINS